MKKLPSLAGLLLLLCAVAGCEKEPARSDFPRHAASEFFLKIGESHFQEAYESAAFAFQARTTFRSFQATARDLGLSAGAMTCNWAKEEPKDGEVKLTGDVISANGRSVPVIVTVIRERGSWRVFSLRTPSDAGNKDEDLFSLVGKGASFNQLANRDIPPESVLNDLVRDNLLLFNTAIQSHDYNTFYSKVSLAWQTQLTVTQLKDAFQPFADAKVNIATISALKPVYDAPPQINADGILSLRGHYPTTPNKVFFTLRFMYEFPLWRLYGIEIQLHN